MDVPLAQNQVLVAPDLDLEPGIGRKQHPILRLDIADGRTHLNDLSPDETAVDVGRGRDQDSRPRLALTGPGVGLTQQAVRGHADRVLAIEGARSAANGCRVGHGRAG